MLLNGFWFVIGETKQGMSSTSARFTTDLFRKGDLSPLSPMYPNTILAQWLSLSLDWAILFRAQFSFLPPLQLLTCCCERCRLPESYRSSFYLFLSLATTLVEILPLQESFSWENPMSCEVLQINYIKIAFESFLHRLLKSSATFNLYIKSIV